MEKINNVLNIRLNSKMQKTNFIVLVVLFLSTYTQHMDISRYQQIRSIASPFKYISLYYFFLFFLIQAKANKFYKQKFKQMLNENAFKVWIVFALVVIYSQLYNSELPLKGMSYLLFNPLIFFFIIPLSIRYSIISIMRAYLIGGLTFLIVSLFLYPIHFGVSYAGITRNPNNIGAISSAVAVLSFCFFAVNVTKKQYYIKYFYLIIFVFSMSILFFSNSRTSLLAAIVAIIIPLSVMLRGGKYIIRNSLLAILALLSIVIFYLKNIFFISVFTKFQTYYDTGNVLTGRDDIWRYVFETRSWFGNGTGYIHEGTGLGGHNVFISFLGDNGIVSAAFLAIFWGLTIVIAYRYYLNNKNDIFSFAPLTIVIMHLIINLGERIFFPLDHADNMAFLLIVGILLQNNVKSHKDDYRRNNIA